MSALNLAVSPDITRKSRHIHTRHHFIRDLISQKLAVIRHLPTEEMLADFFTKPYGPKHFRISRNRLFNTSQLSFIYLDSSNLLPSRHSAQGGVLAYCQFIHAYSMLYMQMFTFQSNLYIILLYYSNFHTHHIIDTAVICTAALFTIPTELFLCFILLHLKFVSYRLYICNNNYSSQFIQNTSSQLYILNPIIKTILFVVFLLLLGIRLILTLDYSLFHSFQKLHS